MALQLDAVSARSDIRGDALANWRAYHVFYHSDRNRMLRHLVRPVVGELLDAGAIDRFFFVRYDLGGPHLRLRWRVTDETASAFAEGVLAERAVVFFARWPSKEPVPEDQIRRTNRWLLEIDPLLRPEDDLVYPDNTWKRLPMQFEVDRYGGLDRLPASLDLFYLSSACVLRLIGEHGEDSGLGSGWKRMTMLRLALRLAWGLAGDSESALLLLAGYGPELMRDRFAPCVEQGDAMFDRKREQMLEMVGRELEGLAAGEADPDGLAAGASSLAASVEGLPAAAQWFLAASHIHMTANRLGLINAEEVYLSRMLGRAVEAFRAQEPQVWERLWSAHADFTRRARCRSLQETVASVLVVRQVES